MSRPTPRGNQREAGVAAVFCGPGLLWLAVFVLVPLLLIVGASFLSRGEYGEMEFPLTFENYRRLAGWGELGFNPLYPRIMVRTLILAGAITVLSLVLALPLAFGMARLRPAWRGLAMTLVVVPFWTNLLIRTYAWQILLSAGGPLAIASQWCGMIPAGAALQPGWFAVTVAMLCDFLPFMVLPLYASVEKIDWALAEAAADLGATRVQVFWHALVPQIRPGLRAGALLVFLPAIGQFVIPDLLGGGQTALLGNLVQQQFGTSRDWPFGAAIATFALALMFAALAVRRWKNPAATTEAGL